MYLVPVNSVIVLLFFAELFGLFVQGFQFFTIFPKLAANILSACGVEILG